MMLHHRYVTHTVPITAEHGWKYRVASNVVVSRETRYRVERRVALKMVLCEAWCCVKFGVALALERRVECDVV